MVGSKPNAYLTEEARLEAQRRMLAERYGLLSDESDEGEDNNEDVPTSVTPANGISSSNSNSNGETNPTSNDTNGRDTHISSQPPPANDPASSEAATYGEGSSVHDGDFALDAPQDDIITNPSSSAALQPPSSNVYTTEKPHPNDRAPGWPGVEIIDSTHGNRICAKYEYDSVKEKDAVSARDLRVTVISSYSSQYVRNHDRKIAVNDRIITYAVGGHIRAILRSSGVRDLLKGHGSAVADIEFLYEQERRLEPESGDSISVLGSVADDGSAYVWKLVRNEDGDEDSLTVADAIRFDHPEMNEGRSYRKIAFRPGPNSIIAEKGIGVAMLLVDAKSPDVRVVELVKMNEKMMVRDKFLRAQNEKDDKSEKNDTAPIDSAAWMSERVVATSRCGKVFLWNADSTLSSCICRLPREKTTRVTSLHAFAEEALLLVVESGRELEVWAASGFAPNVNSTTLELRQTIRIASSDSSQPFAVTCVDPHEELVMLSTVEGTSLFVLHYNRTAQAFDTLTEVPVKHPILSFCMTRNFRRSHSGSGLSTQIANAEPYEEIGVWCVQPKVIQMIHFPMKDCLPRSFVKPEVYPRSIPKSIPRKSDKPMPVSSMASSSLSKLPQLVLPSNPQHSVVRRPPPSSPDSAAKSQNRTSTGVPTGAALQGRQTSSTPALQNTSLRTSSEEGKLKSSVSAVNLSQAIPSTHVQGLPNPQPSPEPAPNANEIADSIIEAAKKAVQNFEQGGAQRSATEKSKMDRLIDSVTETATSNLERFVNSSMKRILAETLIPGMSQIIADTSVALKEKAKVDPKVTEEYFEVAMEKASVNKSFASACQEMERQMSTSVKDSLSSKYEALINPVVNVVNDATEDLTKSVELLRKQIVEMRITGSEGGEKIVGPEPEDAKKRIEEETERGNVDGAFQVALDKEDLSLVTWLCGKFEAGTFFEMHSLSQDLIISLAQQLGQGLAYDEIELKAEWLRELMLVLEPDADGYDTIAEQTVRQLAENVSELRKNREVLMQYDGLEKSLKTLSRLVTSHMQNI